MSTKSLLPSAPGPDSTQESTFARATVGGVAPKFLRHGPITVEINIPSRSMTPNMEEHIVCGTLATLASAPADSFKFNPKSDNRPFGEEGHRALLNAFEQACDSYDKGKERIDRSVQFPGELNSKLVWIRTTGLFNKFEPLIGEGSDFSEAGWKYIREHNASSQVKTDHDQCNIKVDSVMYPSYSDETGITKIWFDPNIRLCSGKICSLSVKDRDDLYKQVEEILNSDDQTITCALSQLQGYTHTQLPHELEASVHENALEWTTKLDKTCRQFFQDAVSEPAREVSSKHLRATPMTLQHLEEGAKLKGEDLMGGLSDVTSPVRRDLVWNMSDKDKSSVMAAQETARKGLAALLKKHYNVSETATLSNEIGQPSIAQLSNALSQSVENIIRYFEFRIEDETTSDSVFSPSVKLNIVNQSQVPEDKHVYLAMLSDEPPPVDYIGIWTATQNVRSSQHSVWEGNPDYVPIMGSTKPANTYKDVSWESTAVGLEE